MLNISKTCHKKATKNCKIQYVSQNPQQTLYVKEKEPLNRLFNFV